MFGLAKKSEVKEIQQELYGQISSLLALNEKLSKELHGTQAALYSLIDKLNGDLILNDNQEPEVVGRS